MAVQTIYSEEALAFWTLYKAMKPEVKEELRNLFFHEAETEGTELSTDAMTAISMDAFRDIWDAPENDHWNDFIKKRLQCTNKEI
jgi:hypothetical protein